MSTTEKRVPLHRLGTHKVTRAAKEPLSQVSDLPTACSCGKGGTFKYVAECRVSPMKWQFACDACGKSVLSRTAPAQWHTDEAARLEKARRAEAEARRKQKEKLFGLEVS